MTADTVPATGESSTAELADRLRRVLHARGTSQSELARWIGMDPTALSKCLTGARRWRSDELAAVAAATGVPLGYLRSGRGRPPKLEVEADYRPRAAALDSEQRRAQIVAVTAGLIARQGIHNVRVADIARQCGTSTGTIHYHFPSKVETLQAALGYYADRLQERLEQEFAQASDSVDKLRRLVEVQLPATDEDVAEWSIWIQSWTEAVLQPQLRAEQGRVYARWLGTVAGLVRGCQREGHGPGADAAALASRFTALVDGLAIQVLSGTGEMTAARMRELLLDAFEPHIRLRPAQGAIMPRPNVEAERREQILLATCAVISEVGMHEMRLADVARRAGVSSGMVHYYFDSKRAVLVAAFEFNFSRSLARRRRLLESKRAPLDLLARLVESFLPGDGQTLAAWRVWAELWAQALRDEEFQAVNERLYGEWRQLAVEMIARAQQAGSARAGDPVELANMLVAMIDGLAIQALAHSAAMPGEQMRATLRAFIGGYLAAPPP